MQESPTNNRHRRVQSSACVEWIAIVALWAEISVSFIREYCAILLAIVFNPKANLSS